MDRPADRTAWTTPREADLGLHRLAGPHGLTVALLPTGLPFAIEHEGPHGKLMINAVLGDLVGGGLGRVCLRRRDGGRIDACDIVGPATRGRFAVEASRATWTGAAHGLSYRCVLWLHPSQPVWLWRIDVRNEGDAPATCDSILMQDLGLGGRGFLMNNEAYASQYIDHRVATHPDAGHVVMSRQNLAQGGGTHPWVMHGCLPRCAAYATDAHQFFGLTHRANGAAEALARPDLPSERLQYEMAAAVLQSAPATLGPGESAAWTFFAVFERDHPAASSDDDLQRIAVAREATAALDDQLHAAPPAGGETPARNTLQSAPLLPAEDLDDATIDRLFPGERRHEERLDGQPLSFFHADASHVVLREKELRTLRRHGHILRGGPGLLLDEATLSSTAWMHGVFSAQLTLGNTSFHKLFSVSRDPLNVTRSGGLRMLVNIDDGWRLLAVPSAFEMGPSEARWVYRAAGRMIDVRASAAGDDAALRLDVAIDGEPCELLVAGHLVLGERELEHAGRVEVDRAARRFTFRPDRDWLWGQRYPQAVYHLVTSTPDAVAAMGGDELLWDDARPRSGAYVALRTRPTRRLSFAIVGSMTDPAEAERLAEAQARVADETPRRDSVRRYWARVTQGARLEGGDGGLATLDEALPWLAHDAMVHLTVPHGLEQYTGAAWGTRDVCQGPVEYLLAVGLHEPVKAILRNVFAQQYAGRGDWPQWYMHEPYSPIQDRHSHGDVIVWPLKALCDYVEATDDTAFLDEPIAWRREEDATLTDERGTVTTHIDKLVATVRERFLPGTSLVRYGEGDWNDALQPADPALRDTMASAWTVALLYQQLRRWAGVLQRAGRQAGGIEALADAMATDFNRHLVRDGVVAGYAIFDGSRARDVLLHPADERTGVRYSLLPMTRSTIGGLFTREQAHTHLRIIRDALLFPDGVRLMDRPTRYAGGVERIFRRAESAAFFGREIGLQYVHAHLRYCEALARLGEADALYDALLVVNPVAVNALLPSAGLRQRNAYFSSSDAAFRDRYEADREWDRARRGSVTYEGGWRVYSSGPGLYVNMVVRHLLGIRRHFDALEIDPVLPRRLDGATFEIDEDHRRMRYIFRVQSGSHTPKRLTINGRDVDRLAPVDHPYRTGGVRVPLDRFRALAERDRNTIEVML